MLPYYVYGRLVNTVDGRLCAENRTDSETALVRKIEIRSHGTFIIEDWQVVNPLLKTFATDEKFFIRDPEMLCYMKLAQVVHQ